MPQWCWPFLLSVQFRRTRKAGGFALDQSSGIIAAVAFGQFFWGSKHDGGKCDQAQRHHGGIQADR